MIIKVCGMREPDNIRAVEQCNGVQWMGFIFYPPSPRYVQAPPAYLPQRCKRAGVFVNADKNEILERAEAFGLDIVQLHGHEPPSLCSSLKAEGLTVVKAFALDQGRETAGRLPFYEGSCHYYLFDTACQGYGGSGRRFNWELTRLYHGHTPFLLSGGIGPDSTDALAGFSHPLWAGIDLNSAFETRPGRKDATAIAQFIHQLTLSKASL